MLYKLLKYYFEASRWQKMPIGKVKRLQLERFRELFNYAKKKSKFYNQLYKNAGVYDLDIKSYEDIEKLPVVDKYMMRKYDYADILTQPITDSLNLHTTSGSTGEPFRVYQTKYEDYTAHVRVFKMLRRYGYHPFRKITMITRYEADDKFKVEQDMSVLSKAQKKFNFFKREIISIYEEPETIINKVEKSKPYILWSTPSVLDMIANVLISKGRTLNIPYVVLTSETILPHQFEKFHKCISKNIVGHYGLVETPTISFDLNNSGKHIVFSNTFLMEYINIRKEEETLLGTPVVTNLVNYTMPFIRYNTYDIGTILNNNNFPLKVMGKIDGRLDDILDFPDGSKFVHHFAHEMFMDFEECEHFKFVQKLNESIKLQIKPNKKFSNEEIKNKALQRWEKRFSKYPLDIEFMDKFEINPRTGKFKNIEKIN